MTRIALLALIGAGLMALPSSAAAQSGATKCPSSAEAHVAGEHVLYVCVHVNGLGGEIVINPARSYINGWSSNPGSTAGYAGFANTHTRDGDCDGDDEGSGSNYGGCFWIKDAPWFVNDGLNGPFESFVTAMFICGNTSGEDPDNSARDGCSIP